MHRRKQQPMSEAMQLYIKAIFDFWRNKNIIFIGPCNHTVSKEEIESYDIVVRTNNFYGMNEADLTSTRCDVLMVNHIFYRTYFDQQLPTIIQRDAKMILVYDEFYRNCLSSVKGKVLVDSFERNAKYNVPVGNKPLLLTRFMAYLSQFNIKKLFITGLDFYSSKSPTEYWKPSYVVKENIQHLSRDAQIHDITKDKFYVRHNLLKNDKIVADMKIIPLLFPEINIDAVANSVETQTKESSDSPGEEKSPSPVAHTESYSVSVSESNSVSVSETVPVQIDINIDGRLNLLKNFDETYG